MRPAKASRTGLSSTTMVSQLRVSESRSSSHEEGAKRQAAPPRWSEMAGDVYERLQARRAEDERTIPSRFPDAFGPEDAEDLVSEALDKALTTRALPADGREDVWFRRVLHNLVID